VNKTVRLCHLKQADLLEDMKRDWLELKSDQLLDHRMWQIHPSTLDRAADTGRRIPHETSSKLPAHAT